MKEDQSPDEFAPIAAAMKRLPYFEPSPDFAEKVLANVRISGARHVPTLAESRPLAADGRAVAPRPAYVRELPATPAPAPLGDFTRSIPARLAAVALVSGLTVTLSVVALFTMFQMDLFILVARVFGEGALGYLAALGTEAAIGASTAASSSAAAAGTLQGAAVAGSFVIGAIAATAGLRAAASASRRAA